MAILADRMTSKTVLNQNFFLDDDRQSMTSLSTHISQQNAEMKMDKIQIKKINRNIRRILKNRSILQKISPTTAKCVEKLKSWFHGPMDRFKAVPLLKNDGDFLIRLGKSMDDLTYKPVLSVKWDKRHYNFLIKQRLQLFWIEKLQFSTIMGLIKYYLQTGNPLTTHSGVQLKNPILCQKWNPVVVREEQHECKQLSASTESSERSNHAVGTQSLNYIVFDDQVPYILNHVFALVGICVAVIVLYICTIF